MIRLALYLFLVGVGMPNVMDAYRAIQRPPEEMPDHMTPVPRDIQVPPVTKG